MKMRDQISTQETIDDRVDICISAAKPGLLRRAYNSLLADLDRKSQQEEMQKENGTVQYGNTLGSITLHDIDNNSLRVVGAGAHKNFVEDYVHGVLARIKDSLTINSNLVSYQNNDDSY